MSGPARAALAVFVATLGIAAAACSSGDGAAPSTTAAPTSVTTTTVDRSSAPATSVSVFAQGESGYDTFRIPAVVAAANGTLLAFAEGRRGSANDAGDVDLVLKRSSDDGATWSPLQVLADDGANFVGNPSPVVDASTGNLVLAEAAAVPAEPPAMRSRPRRRQRCRVRRRRRLRPRHWPRC